jgi:hypothetical protein
VVVRIATRGTAGSKTTFQGATSRSMLDRRAKGRSTIQDENVFKMIKLNLPVVASLQTPKLGR